MNKNLEYACITVNCSGFILFTAGPACEHYQGKLCFAKGMIGYDKVFINSSGQYNQADYEDSMERLLPTFDEYTEQCRKLFHQLLCATNFASCDLSKTTPTPIRVSMYVSVLSHLICQSCMFNIQM